MPGCRGCEASRSKLEKVPSTRVCGRLGHGDTIVKTALGGHWAWHCRLSVLVLYLARESIQHSSWVVEVVSGVMCVGLVGGYGDERNERRHTAYDWKSSSLMIHFTVSESDYSYMIHVEPSIEK